MLSIILIIIFAVSALYYLNIKNNNEIVEIKPFLSEKIEVVDYKTETMCSWAKDGDECELKENSIKVSNDYKMIEIETVINNCVKLEFSHIEQDETSVKLYLNEIGDKCKNGSKVERITIDFNREPKDDDVINIYKKNIQEDGQIENIISNQRVADIEKELIIKEEFRLEKLEVVDYKIETVCPPFECEQADFDKTCDLGFVEQNHIVIGVWKNLGTSLELDYIEENNERIIIYFNENGYHIDAGNILVKVDIELKSDIINDKQITVFHNNIEESKEIKQMEADGNCRLLFFGI